jgi:hypothetical protein
MDHRVKPGDDDLDWYVVIASHRARIRAPRWLAMTAFVEFKR